jgi:hypothetical protein
MLTKVSYSMITSTPLNVVDYGASPSNTASQNDAAFAAVLAKITADGGGEIYIPAGTYAYGTTLNFGIDNLIVRGQGRKTVLQFNGTGNCIEMVGNPSAGQYTTLDSFAVSGTATATNGIYITNWTKFQLLNISVGNVTQRGIYTGYIVFAYMLNPTVYNFDWGPSGFAVQPQTGIELGRPVGGSVTYPDTCALTIVGLNVQGVSGSGLKCVNGFSNVFAGGSSEYNNTRDLEIQPDFRQSTFINLDYENTPPITNVYVNGIENTFIGGLVPFSACKMEVGPNSNQNKFIGGTFGSIDLLSGATLNSFTDVTISGAGGLVDNGTNTKFDNVIVNTVPFYQYNAAQKSKDGFYSIGGTLTAVATATATTMFTSQYGSYMLTVLIPNAGANYVASTFVIDDAANCQLSNYANGAAISITVSGKNVQVTQTSGAPQDIVWCAIRMPVVS